MAVPVATNTMRTGLLLLRSCMSFCHRGSHSSIHRQQQSLYVSSRSIVCHHPSSLKQRVYTPPLVNVRPLSSSSASSFEAPEPPKSQGQAVFPDIQFQTPSSEEEHAASIRNADPGAVFVVNGSSRGIGLQFVDSLLERTKVSGDRVFPWSWYVLQLHDCLLTYLQFYPRGKFSPAAVHLPQHMI